ncbi:hypothetical protein LguiB_018079 [Lonicera macranthoides]
MAHNFSFLSLYALQSPFLSSLSTNPRLSSLSTPQPTRPFSLDPNAMNPSISSLSHENPIDFISRTRRFHLSQSRFTKLGLKEFDTKLGLQESRFTARLPDQRETNHRIKSSTGCVAVEESVASSSSDNRPISTIVILIGTLERYFSLSMHYIV